MSVLWQDFSFSNVVYDSPVESLFSFEMQPRIPFLPVFASMKRLARYSLGSVALGSLIVSFVESIRCILEGLRRKLKNADPMPNSWIGTVAYGTSQGCLKCIVCIIKSVNRNAYIMVSLLINLLDCTGFAFGAIIYNFNKISLYYVLRFLLFR